MPYATWINLSLESSTFGGDTHKAGKRTFSALSNSVWKASLKYWTNLISFVALKQLLCSSSIVVNFKHSWLVKKIGWSWQSSPGWFYGWMKVWSRKNVSLFGNFFNQKPQEEVFCRSYTTNISQGNIHKQSF